MISFRKIFSVHSWFGLISGLFLLLIGCSGSMLIYRSAIERWLHPGLYHLAPQQKIMPYDELYRKVAKKYSPGFESYTISIPKHPTDVVEFTLSHGRKDHHSNPLYIVDIDPYSGTILREGYCDELSTSLTHWLLYFHHSFQYGTIGKMIDALAAISIFISMATGLFIYLKSMPKVLLFKIPLQWENRTIFYRRIHRIIGVWALLFNMLLFFTGFWMAKGVFSLKTWQLIKPRSILHIETSIDECLRKSKEIFPGFEPTEINGPTTTDDNIVINGNTDGTSPFLYGLASYVSFNPKTSEVVERYNINDVSLAEKFEGAVWPLHIASFGGHLVKILYVIGGFTPGMLSLTGFLLWRRGKTRSV